ncbi:PP2C family protein-serine/threonine phosphatase [Thermoflexibacter ruber]|uniref:Stage II sporulation protein E (SpoIIE) n=1 Tax=Thermoflexibacter ruber TaxID=1003 RepID=A0A1I2JRV3_9BACT|nr:SpoIIE family protein phosphatase [Thermoflexibacter ruber]SFF55441.1 Stage II sporulation protein E (SpoIIE) [Thermoflexibacter ruber]
MSIESYELGMSHRILESKKENKIVIVAADCTGHGVPGAFMSLIGNELLNQIVNVHHITSPELILNQLHKGIRYALKQDETANRDGMDIAICVIDKEEKILEYAGAMNPFYYIQDNQFFEIKADKKSIGGLQSEEERIFTKHTIQLGMKNLESGINQQQTTSNQQTIFYLCSDGFQDQFGGAENRKFMVRRLRELLASLALLPMSEQKEILDKTFEEWKGKHPQIDDVLIFGVKI